MGLFLCKLIIVNLLLLKKMKRVNLFSAIFTFLVISANCFGQTSASFNSTAKVITAITIQKNTDLDFGTFSVTTSAGGTLSIAAGAVAGRSFTGGVVYLQSTTATAAKFTLGGEGGYQFNLTLAPTTVTMSDGHGNSLSIGTFSTDISGGTGAINSTSGLTASFPGSVPAHLLPEQQP